jgi:hypothetical protein
MSQELRWDLSKSAANDIAAISGEETDIEPLSEASDSIPYSEPE